MRLHVVLPSETLDLTADQVVDVARHAEDLGFGGVYLSDHLLPPMPFGQGPFNGIYEPLVTLAYVAAATRQIRLGTSILVLPMRDPFLLAKQAATIDRLSGGRLTLGVGLGWSEEEFANVHADFGTRGARADEALDLLRRLWQEGAGPFEGRFYDFQQGYFAPIPGPGLKLMVGGTSPAALRRAARVADVWQSPPIDPAEFRGLAGQVRKLADRPIEVAGRLQWDDPATPLDAVLEQVAAWEQVGADELAVFFGAPKETFDRMTELAQARGLKGATS